MELTKSNYDGEVLKSNVPVLVDFFATWCGPCKMAAPVISQIEEEYAGKIKVGKIDVDAESEIASMNAIVSIPTVILFVNGKAVERMVGAKSFDDYADVIEKYI